MSQQHARADEYEKMRLRGIKFQKDLVEIIEEADSRLAQIPTKDKSENSICDVSGQLTKSCAHCRLTRMENKYSVTKH